MLRKSFWLRGSLCHETHDLEDNSYVASLRRESQKLKSEDQRKEEKEEKKEGSQIMWDQLAQKKDSNNEKILEDQRTTLNKGGKSG
jgi:hypothetical protein